MNTPVESEGSDRLKPIKTAISNVFEQRGAIAALQLVAALRRKDLPTLPKLGTRDPANPTERIEGAAALIIGERIIVSRGRGRKVILIALFPEVAKDMPVEETSFVEFRSYQQLIPEQVPGRTLLVPAGPLIEGHQLIFAKAEKPEQLKLIEATLEAIYLKS